MARYNQPSKPGTLAAVLALKLREIQRTYASPESFAKQAGISIANYYKLLKPDANPTFRTVENIAANLGVPVSNLLGMTNSALLEALAEDDMKLEEVRAHVMQLRERAAPKKKTATSIDDPRSDEESPKKTD